MDRSDVVFGAVLMGLASLTFGLTFRFPEQSLALSPAFFPRVIASLLFLCSGLLLCRGLREGVERITAAKRGAPFPTERIASAVLMGFGYTALLETGGYVLATPLLIAGLMIVFRERHWIRIGAVSVLSTLALYYLFRTLFRVPLPRFELF